MVDHRKKVNYKGINLNKPNKLNRLKGLATYLSGPIDFAEDMGCKWRNDLTPFLEDMNIKVFNPLRHAFVGADKIPEKRIRMDKLLTEEKFTELHKEMKELVHMDLRSVDLASFLIVHYDSTVSMCGTLEELFKCNMQVKPVLLVHKEPRKQLSSWLYGRLPPEHFFANWDELKIYLTSINSNPNYEFTKADRKRWLLFQ